MRLGLAIAGLLAVSGPAAWASHVPGPRPLAARQEAVADDLRLILQKAGMRPELIRLGKIEVSGDPRADRNEVVLRCAASAGGGRVVFLDVSARSEEWAATAYFGLQKLGFLFPHPRIQVSPALSAIPAHCGERYLWRPRFKIRGFHLHTQHPNEWLRGFLMGETRVADDLVRWLARNGQNALQVYLLRGLPRMAESFKEPFALAGSLGVLRGLSLSFNELQQQSFRLVPPLSLAPLRSIRLGLEELLRTYDFDYVTCDLGSTEFVGSRRAQTLEWVEVARLVLESAGKTFFAKVHVSRPEADPSRNFNFLPAESAPSVGVQVHTVMFYGLEDAHAPVYGRKDFSDIRDFLFAQSPKRPTWYFPETSYWVAMDIDVPLFLTDYLKARSRDMDLASTHGISGHMTFTSGQELGYWLMDWTVALLANQDYAGQPMIGLKLLGEDLNAWSRVLEFQSLYLKDVGLLGILSSENLLDELPFLHFQVHERKALGELSRDPQALSEQISKLNSAALHFPSLAGIRNPELRAMLEVTEARIRFALLLRQAMQGTPESAQALLAKARAIRLEAAGRVEGVIASNARYPELPLFAQGVNPTSYAYGYLWPARTLRYWADEEAMVEKRRYFMPDFELFNPLRIVNPF